MTKLKGAAKRYLRSLANRLNPVVIIGQRGLTDSVIQKADKALLDHELIKVKFLDFKEDKKALSGKLASETGSELVGMIGHNALLYRQHPQDENRRIVLP